MKTVHTIVELKQAVHLAKLAAKPVGFVPTMGNLHAGHISLVKAARSQCGFNVCSIFVNPTQFGANEDLDSYPRTLADDQAKLQAAGLDLVFAPSVSEMYPNGTDMQAKVVVPGISDQLCGASRPAHFTGVATVVSKLFNMVEPDEAFFGEKDFQQVMVIKRFTQELAFPVNIVSVPTQREANGLAMSSRNGYLSQAEKQQAALVFKTLQQTAEQLLQVGFNVSAESITAACQQACATLSEKGFEPDYFAIRRQLDLGEPTPQDTELVILVAAKLAGTRLIDNLKVSLGH